MIHNPGMGLRGMHTRMQARKAEHILHARLGGEARFSYQTVAGQGELREEARDGQLQRVESQRIEAWGAV